MLLPISIHALLAESDLAILAYLILSTLFLSTLSLRRATNEQRQKDAHYYNFYPRSPCGERLASRLADMSAA